MIVRLFMIMFAVAYTCCGQADGDLSNIRAFLADKDLILSENKEKAYVSSTNPKNGLKFFR